MNTALCGKPQEKTQIVLAGGPAKPSLLHVYSFHLHLPPLPQLLPHPQHLTLLHKFCYLTRQGPVHTGALWELHVMTSWPVNIACPSGCCLRADEMLSCNCQLAFYLLARRSTFLQLAEEFSLFWATVLLNIVEDH